jgi:hypothetical protein
MNGVVIGDFDVPHLRSSWAKYSFELHANDVSPRWGLAIFSPQRHLPSIYYPSQMHNAGTLRFVSEIYVID